MGKGEASTAGRKEPSPEKEADTNPLQMDDDDDDDEDEEVIPEEGSAAALYGNCGVISVLFKTPSGFAIFGYDAVKLTDRDALEHIWADFVNVPKTIVWREAFQTFEDNAHAISASNISSELATMIKKHVVIGQTLAVENEDYKKVIEGTLGIRCLYNTLIKELMWGLKIQMWHLVPEENSQLTYEESFPMSEGLELLLKYHKFEINPHMMVTRRIIGLAGIIYECDRCVNKYSNSLRFAAEHILNISRIKTGEWDLMKLATTIKMICDPEGNNSAAKQLLSKRQLNRLMQDASRYKDKIFKIPFMEVYKEMYSARKIRLEAARVLLGLVNEAKKAYEAEQADKAASDHEIGPGRKICHGINTVIIDELPAWHTTLSAKLKDIQVSPTLVPVDALERYTQISSHPLNTMNRPGILCMDIHPSKITTSKFVSRNGLITGSADKSVHIWQGSNGENYDISTGSCLAQVGESSGQEGYTSAAFHPDGLIFGTGTTDAVVDIWDVKSQTAALDGVKLWDLRNYRNFKTLSPYNPDTPTNAGALEKGCSQPDAMVTPMLRGLKRALEQCSWSNSKARRRTSSAYVAGSGLIPLGWQVNQSWSGNLQSSLGHDAEESSGLNAQGV